MKEDFLEEIKKAISSTVKAIAENKDLEVVFEDNQFSTENKIVLPKIENQDDVNSLSELRGSADNQALMHKYHDKVLFNKLAPTGSKNKEIYETLENTRIQMIGGSLMRGVKSNLYALYKKKCNENDLENISAQSDIDIKTGIDLYFRSQVSPDLVPKNASKAVSLWTKWLQKKIGNSTDELIKSIHSQKLFAENVKKILTELNYYDQSENNEENKDDENNNKLEEL